jgi:hypothetical protein
VPFTAKYSHEEYARLQEGLIPKAMEDKWFIYFDEPHLFLHRRVRRQRAGSYATTCSCIWVAAATATGVGNACSRGFERPRASGDRRGASALAQLSRCGMTNAISQKWGCGDRIMLGRKLLMMACSSNDRVREKRA